MQTSFLETYLIIQISRNDIIEFSITRGKILLTSQKILNTHKSISNKIIIYALLCFGLLLREDSEDKVRLLVCLEGGRDDEVLARGKTKACAHLPQVDEGLRTGAR